jgi:hypothetical protein
MEGSPEEESMEMPEEEAAEDNTQSEDPVLSEATDEQILSEAKMRGLI